MDARAGALVRKIDGTEDEGLEAMGETWDGECADSPTDLAVDSNSAGKL